MATKTLKGFCRVLFDVYDLHSINNIIVLPPDVYDDILDIASLCNIF